MDDLLKRTQNTKQYHHPNQHVPLGVVIYPSLEVFFYIGSNIKNVVRIWFSLYFRVPQTTT